MKMASKSKFSVCRLCLSNGEVLVNIFEGEEEDGFEVKATVEDLLRVEVLTGCELPWIVCKSCILKLKNFSDFRLKCLTSNTAFVQMYLKIRARETTCWDRIEAKEHTMAVDEERLCTIKEEDQSLDEVDNSGCGIVNFPSTSALSVGTHKTKTLKLDNTSEAVQREAAISQMDSNDDIPRDPLGESEDCSGDDTGDGETITDLNVFYEFSVECQENTFEHPDDQSRFPPPRHQPGEVSTEDEVITAPHPQSETLARTSLRIGSLAVPPPPKRTKRVKEEIVSQGEVGELYNESEQVELLTLRKEVKKLKRTLQEVQINQQEMMKEIKELRTHAKESRALPKQFQPPISLPVRSLESLVELEAGLKSDDEFQDYLLQCFSGLHTTNLGKFLRTNLNKIMENKVAEGLNWAGTRGKKSIKDFHTLIYILTEASKKVENRYEEKEFKVEVSNWLSQASRRKNFC